MVSHELPRRGTLLTWARAHIAVNDIDPPYVLGLVEIGGARVFCHVRTDDDLPVPSSVIMDLDMEAKPPFWVSPLQPKE